MPYALCPMPVGQIVPHVTEKGYIALNVGCAGPRTLPNIKQKNSR
jgi:hypothetical protein